MKSLDVKRSFISLSKVHSPCQSINRPLRGKFAAVMQVDLYEIEQLRQDNEHNTCQNLDGY